MVGINLLEEPGSDPLWYKNVSMDERQTRGKQLFERCEYVQLRVRFVALEAQTVRSGDKVVQRGQHELVTSTWAFEGRIWTVTPPSKAGVEDDDDPAQIWWMANRRRNPQLLWKLAQIYP